MTGAKMWPHTLPQQVRDDPLRSAEVKVFDLLENQLGDDWTVFYSRPWLGITPYGEEKDGEADFVVVHPDRGLLTIEVKGGEITRDPAAMKWVSRDRHGVRHYIKDPVRQATSAEHNLFKKVQVMPGWPGNAFLRTRHGIVFTDTEDPPGNLGAEMPREIFCCRRELPRIGGWVRARLSGGKGDPIGAAGIKLFEDLLALPFTLRVPLGNYLSDDDQTIESLTPQQFYVLDAVAHMSRVAAGGGAGTGKTIVALEDARRLAEAGLKTVLLCLGDRLAVHLRERLKGTPVQVWTFAELCRHYAASAGLVADLPASDAIEKGPDLLIRAVKKDKTLRLDAIVVDEAQDFRTQWWIALEDILVDPKSSRLHAFYDTNQSVYGDLTGELAAFAIVPIRLTRNLRNTKAIHTAASRFYRGNPITADGPQGYAVAWKTCTPATMDKQVVDTVRELTIEGEVAPENIVVLAMSEKVILLLQQRLAAFEGVTITHVRDFKGLERQAVVLVATREIADERELAYVALSRPRAHLTVVGEADILSWLEGR
ncbi:hypothetical protein A9K65_013425 [Mesorhizobium sp. WSM1497]|uniref:AAA family ATPase n=1 Tax=Mesorhizobium sp. WSM1497 TaxID=278153 RepID=UPI0007EE143B|nr:AAA family ATPase [Mesorhizobium sp. WSM1497]ARP64271.1 hypothetical protein A9K65_013425 [Mesorhizobium sp. WSM1497]